MCVLRLEKVISVRKFCMELVVKCVWEKCWWFWGFRASGKCVLLIFLCLRVRVECILEMFDWMVFWLFLSFLLSIVWLCFKLIVCGRFLSSKKRWRLRLIYCWNFLWKRRSNVWMLLLIWLVWCFWDIWSVVISFWKVCLVVRSVVCRSLSFSWVRRRCCFSTNWCWVWMLWWWFWLWFF